MSHLEAQGNEQMLTTWLLEGSQLVNVRLGPDQEVQLEAAGWQLFDGAGEALEAQGPLGREDGPARREPQLPRLG